jgi:hypothetical protein
MPSLDRGFLATLAGTLDEVQSRTSEKLIQMIAGCRAGAHGCSGFGSADKMLRSTAITAVILVLETGT